MEIKLVVWHNGDPSVGIQGESFEVTLKVEPTPYFAQGDDADTKECIGDFTKSLKKLVEDNMDYLDCDFKMHIQTPEEMAEDYKAELQMEKEMDALMRPEGLKETLDALDSMNNKLRGK